MKVAAFRGCVDTERGLQPNMEAHYRSSEAF